MHACIEYVFCACSGLGDTHPPVCIWLETTYACGIINSSSTASFLWICTQAKVQPIFVFIGGFYLSMCLFSIGFFKAAHIVSEFYLNSLWVQQWNLFLREFQRQLQKYQKNRWISVKCWNVRPSCYSRHVECTKTWMRDLSSVLWEDRMLSLKLDSQPSLVLP